MKSLPKLMRTSPAGWLGLIKAYYYLSLAGWHLFVRKQSVAPWVLMGDMPSPSADSITEEEERLATSAARWVNAAARRPFPWARCLQRSLALCLLLERQNIHPSIRIGAQKAGDGIEAHAWVEYKGLILNDREVITTMFPTLSGSLGELAQQ